MAISTANIEQKLSQDSDAPLPPPLAYTCSDAFKDTVQDSLEGLDLDWDTKRKIGRELHKACMEGDLETVKRTLEAYHIGINARLGDMSDPLPTLFEIALHWNQKRILEFLLKEPSILIPKTALGLALARVLCIDTYRISNPYDFEGANFQAAATLIKKGADINSLYSIEVVEEKYRNSTLLMRAWLLGKQEVAEKLISLGADIVMSEKCYFDNLKKDEDNLKSRERMSCWNRLSEHAKVQTWKPEKYLWGRWNREPEAICTIEQECDKVAKVTEKLLAEIFLSKVYSLNLNKDAGSAESIQPSVLKKPKMGK